MMMDAQTGRFLEKYPAIATIGYFAVIFSLILVAWYEATSLYDNFETVTAARDTLERLEGRKPNIGGPNSSANPSRPGSPFLEGQTVTIAGAALLQRVTGAVTQVGGSVLSTQVDVQGAPSKDGFVGLIASCEIGQPELQKLLYDIEAGMPYLYIDQLTVQAPESASGVDARLRVLLSVSGQWRGTR